MRTERNGWCRCLERGGPTRLPPTQHLPLRPRRRYGRPFHRAPVCYRLAPQALWLWIDRRGRRDGAIYRLDIPVPMRACTRRRQYPGVGASVEVQYHWRRIGDAGREPQLGNRAASTDFSRRLAASLVGHVHLPTRTTRERPTLHGFLRDDLASGFFSTRSSSEPSHKMLYKYYQDERRRSFIQRYCKVLDLMVNCRLPDRPLSVTRSDEVL